MDLDLTVSPSWPSHYSKTWKAYGWAAHSVGDDDATALFVLNASRELMEGGSLRVKVRSRRGRRAWTF